ncbi:hypothetical protein EPN18_10280 [bacterium]|nr:MAG: hypothetical protein EPN18_10280 [bacterium]
MESTEMTAEIVKEIRKTCVFIGVFSAVFVLMYIGVVLIIKNTFIFFIGLMPSMDKTLLRLIFYVLSASLMGVLFFIRRRRFSSKSLSAKSNDVISLIKYVMNTVIWSMALALGPAISGFFIFALGNLLYDFLVLSAISFIAIYINVPAKAWLELKLFTSLS